MFIQNFYFPFISFSFSILPAFNYLYTVNGFVGWRLVQLHSDIFFNFNIMHETELSVTMKRVNVAPCVDNSGVDGRKHGDKENLLDFACKM